MSASSILTVLFKLAFPKSLPCNIYSSYFSILDKYPQLSYHTHIIETIRKTSFSV